jgi:hypothetical protein
MKAFALIAVLSLAAACGGGGGATTRPGATGPAQPSTGGQPSSGGQSSAAATSAPQPGAGTVAVIVTGGEHQGVYTASGNPNCSYSFFSTNTWGVQYSITDAAPDDLSSVQLVYRPDGTGGDEDDMFAGTSLLLTVAFGDLLDSEAYTEYTVEVRADDEEGKGTGTAEVGDAGTTALIHATGTTDEGVEIDATITCPNVSRP